MLSKEEIEDLMKDCSINEIKRINDSLEGIKKGNTLTHKEIRSFIDNELFSKYKINA